MGQSGERMKRERTPVFEPRPVPAIHIDGFAAVRTIGSDMHFVCYADQPTPNGDAIERIVVLRSIMPLDVVSRVIPTVVAQLPAELKRLVHQRLTD